MLSELGTTMKDVKERLTETALSVANHLKGVSVVLHYVIGIIC